MGVAITPPPPPQGCWGKELLIMPRYCQSISAWTCLLLPAHMWLMLERDVPNMMYSESKAGLVISTVTNQLLAVGRTRFSHLEIVSYIQISSWMHLYPCLVVQTGIMTTAMYHVGFSMWGLGFIVTVIPATHLLDVWAVVLAMITPGLVPSSAIFICMIPTATRAGVLMIIVATAAQGPATRNQCCSATAAAVSSRLVVGAAAISGRVCLSVQCMLLLCRLGLGVLAMHLHGIHSLSMFII